MSRQLDEWGLGEQVVAKIARKTEQNSIRKLAGLAGAIAACAIGSRVCCCNRSWAAKIRQVVRQATAPSRKYGSEYAMSSLQETAMGSGGMPEDFLNDTPY